MLSTENTLGKLEKTVPIIDQDWPKKTLPLVSICCITYNQENLISEAIESLLMQETTFKVEIIIYDDASTDSTAKILEEYIKKYPELIVPILQTKNQYSQGIKPFANFVFPRARGKFIALCEGDDYWIEHCKLQKQVEFLDANNNVSLVFSDRIRLKDLDKTVLYYKDKIYRTDDILSGFIPGIQSMCFRRSSLDMEKYQELAMFINEDRLIPYLCSLNGHIRWVRGLFSVYRNTGNGVSSSRPIKSVLEISLHDILKFHNTLNFPNDYALLKAEVSYIGQYSIGKMDIKRLFKVVNEINLLYNKSVKSHLFIFFFLFFRYVLLKLLKKVRILKYSWY